MLRKVKYVVATLPYSNVYFAKAYPIERLESLLDGIQAAFAYMGGVTDRVVLDNTTIAVKQVLTGRDRVQTGHGSDVTAPVRRRYRRHYRVAYHPSAGRAYRRPEAWDVAGRRPLSDREQGCDEACCRRVLPERLPQPPTTVCRSGQPAKSRAGRRVGGELLLSPQSVEIIKFGDPGSGR